MENGSKSESAQTEVIAPVWRDWHTVGSDFRRFEGLSKLEQDAIMRGDTVASEVMINDDMLWGSLQPQEGSNQRAASYLPNIERPDPGMEHRHFLRPQMHGKTVQAGCMATATWILREHLG